MNSKQIGNKEERKQSKLLSEWMFGDPHMLKRSSDSGAQKTVWCGDVVPVKQLPDGWNKLFPFMIEVKTGYDDHKPDFWNYNMLNKWIIKSVKESKIQNQYIILLITQFKNMTPLLTTNYVIPVTPYNVSIPIEVDGEWISFFVYNYRKLLKNFTFNQIFNLSIILGI